jgi:hypothetical protein
LERHYPLDKRIGLLYDLPTGRSVWEDYDEDFRRLSRYDVFVFRPGETNLSLTQENALETFLFN